MDRTFSPFAQSILDLKYAQTKADGTKETWEEVCTRVIDAVFSPMQVRISDSDKNKLLQFMVDRKFIPGGRYLYAAGRQYHNVSNCILMRAEDSREGWADLMQRVTVSLMTGAGVGVDYSDLRPSGAVIKRTGGQSTGPIALMQMINESGRHIMQGGGRRSALWAGLRWDHDDIFTFMSIKDWSKEVRELKEKDFNFPATLDGTNISVLLNDEFFKAYEDSSHTKHEHAKKVYHTAVQKMLSTGEPGFSVDTGQNSKETLRNPCCEISSEDDSDICNLGSINLARVSDVHEMDELVRLGTMMLLAGTVYTDVPYQKLRDTQQKNRRLGLGVMGIHEVLGGAYYPTEKLERYLEIYARSGVYANQYADEWGISRPVKTRAIAPNGSIGILAETTTGIEPIFCAAYKRRYVKGSDWHYQYVVDPTARRILANNPDAVIEDAYSLGFEQRLAMQSFVQKYVDHAISSTINLPQWGSTRNNESLVDTYAAILYKYLPTLRGITAYPDGARGGQPLSPVFWDEAVGQEGREFVEDVVDICDISKSGTCGS